MRERLAELGQRPQYGVELEGSIQDAEGVSARISSPGELRGHGVDITHQDADDAGGRREQRDETIEELERVTTSINKGQRLFRRTIVGAS